MKYGTKEITELLDIELVQIVQNLNSVEKAREKASKHPKFNEDRIINGRNLKKMEFPSLTPQYLEMKQELLNELKKRKLEIEQ
jgi:hypothetical protein